MSTIKNKILALREEKIDIDEKIEKLQKECEHEATDILLHSWRTGAMHPAKICLECHKVLGEPETPEEKAKAIKMISEMQRDVFEKYNGIKAEKG